MRRRLVVAIVGAVVASVTVVGAGTLALIRIDARQRSEAALADQAEALAAVLADVRPARAAAVARRLEESLGVDDARLFSLDTPPSWLAADDAGRLRAGTGVSARRGDRVYAAAPLVAVGGAPAPRGVLLTDTVDADFGAAGRWFVVAGAATALAGVAAAFALARTLARPVAATATTADRIAQGDLDARVAEPTTGVRDDELARLARSINAMAASLQQSRQSEREFLLSVSHDLRTPLTSIGGWAEALADGAAPDPAAAGETIRVASSRLDRLVQDLLDLARLRAQAFTLDRAPVDLRDVATGTLDGLRPELEDSGLVVSLSVPDEPVVVDGDADRLAQIIANLVDNAGRHAATSLRLEVGVGPDRSLLAVEDDGPGIPTAERPLVFERLHTNARPAARGGTGTGLGLAIVRELARALGGDATATEAPSGGARLVVTLPLSTSGSGHDGS
jgi:two-component system, OmpR family, sensor kinase